MSYEIGTHVDLTYINKKAQVSEKKSNSEQARTLFDVGTQFVFQFTSEGLKAGIKIPVAFA